MMSTRSIAAASLAGLLLAGAAFAQTPPAAAPAAPAATSTAPATPAAAPATDKQAKAKACIDEANQKGLHGKARKHFKSQCKRGKA